VRRLVIPTARIVKLRANIGKTPGLGCSKAHAWNNLQTASGERKEALSKVPKDLR